MDLNDQPVRKASVLAMTRLPNHHSANGFHVMPGYAYPLTHHPSASKGSVAHPTLRDKLITSLSLDEAYAFAWALVSADLGKVVVRHLQLLAASPK